VSFGTLDVKGARMVRWLVASALVWAMASAADAKDDAGTDGKIGIADPCDTYVTDFGAAHVISCKDVVQVP
jgi:hypothetical protein